MCVCETGINSLVQEPTSGKPLVMLKKKKYKMIGFNWGEQTGGEKWV